MTVILPYLRFKLVKFGKSTKKCYGTDFKINSNIYHLRLVIYFYSSTKELHFQIFFLTIPNEENLVSSSNDFKLFKKKQIGLLVLNFVEYIHFSYSIISKSEKYLMLIELGARVVMELKVYDVITNHDSAFTIMSKADLTENFFHRLFINLNIKFIF